MTANWLAGAWDQNTPISVMSPTGVVCERIALGRIIDLLGLPKSSWGGLVTRAESTRNDG